MRGLGSLNNLRILGSAAFIEASNSGLFLLVWILNKISSTASVLYLRFPSLPTLLNILTKLTLMLCYLSIFFSFYSLLFMLFFIFSNRL